MLMEFANARTRSGTLEIAPLGRRADHADSFNRHGGRRRPRLPGSGRLDRVHRDGEASAGNRRRRTKSRVVLIAIPGDNRSHFINSIWTETYPKLSRALPDGSAWGDFDGKQGCGRIAAVGRRTNIGQRWTRYFEERCGDLPYGGCTGFVCSHWRAAARPSSPKKASALNLGVTRTDRAFPTLWRLRHPVLVHVPIGRVVRSQRDNRVTRSRESLGPLASFPEPRPLSRVTARRAQVIHSGQPSSSVPDEYDKAERRLPLGFACSFRNRFRRILLCGSPCRMRERAAGSPQRVARPSRGQRGIPVALLQALVTITRRVGAVLAAFVVRSERCAGAAPRPASEYVAIRVRPRSLRQIVSVRDIRFRPASFRPFDGKHRAR